MVRNLFFILNKLKKECKMQNLTNINVIKDIMSSIKVHSIQFFITFAQQNDEPDIPHNLQTGSIVCTMHNFQHKQ